MLKHTKKLLLIAATVFILIVYLQLCAIYSPFPFLFVLNFVFLVDGLEHYLHLWLTNPRVDLHVHSVWRIFKMAPTIGTLYTDLIKMPIIKK